jgi:signal transduction histidine kinase
MQVGDAPSPAVYLKLRHALGERIKELTILHSAAEILAEDARPVAAVLRDLVDLMPPAWQYPETTAARIAIGELEIATSDFVRGPYLQEAEFTTSNGQHGVVQVVYLEERPAEAEGPFLSEERSLIDSLAHMVNVALDRRIAWNEVRQINAELDRRIAARTAELEAVRRSLEAFTYSVAHDLKAPLRGIDGYSRLLLEDYSERLEAEARGFLYNIRSSAQRMNQLIDDLLTYSRLERRAFTASTVSLRRLVNALVEERRADLESGQVQLIQHMQCDQVVADADALAQALRNYLDNAIKFTRDVPAPRIEIDAEEGAGCCRVWVRDNGIGFDMKYHDRIFEIFERLHPLEKHPGTGIGLAIVRKAMERLCGRAWAESAPDRGATFYIEIPSRGELQQQ